jgi:hypothetical protein
MTGAAIGQSGMYILWLGIVNWLVTLIMVEGAIFAPLRHWVKAHDPWKFGYLVHCHLCAGTWVGWALAVATPYRPIDSWPLIDVLLAGLTYKAVGHITLEATALMRRTNAISAPATSRRRPQSHAHPQLEIPRGHGHLLDRERRSPDSSTRITPIAG